LFASGGGRNPTPGVGTKEDLIGGSESSRCPPFDGQPGSVSRSSLAFREHDNIEA
jgi:hypothetical protein